MIEGVDFLHKSTFDDIELNIYLLAETKMVTIGSETFSLSVDDRVTINDSNQLVSVDLPRGDVRRIADTLYVFTTGTVRTRRRCDRRGTTG